MKKWGIKFLMNRSVKNAPKNWCCKNISCTKMMVKFWYKNNSKVLSSKRRYGWKYSVNVWEWRGVGGTWGQCLRMNWGGGGGGRERQAQSYQFKEALHQNIHNAKTRCGWEVSEQTWQINEHFTIHSFFFLTRPQFSKRFDSGPISNPCDLISLSPSQKRREKKYSLT